MRTDRPEKHLGDKVKRKAAVKSSLKVVRVLSEIDQTMLKRYQLPSTCPVCGQPVVKPRGSKPSPAASTALAQPFWRGRCVTGPVGARWILAGLGDRLGAAVD